MLFREKACDILVIAHYDTAHVNLNYIRIYIYISQKVRNNNNNNNNKREISLKEHLQLQKSAEEEGD